MSMLARFKIGPRVRLASATPAAASHFDQPSRLSRCRRRNFDHIARPARPASLRRELRTAHREAVVWAQLRNLEPRLVAVAVAHRDVDILAHEVDLVHGRRDPQVDRRIRLGEPAQTMHQPFGGRIGRRADREVSGGLALHQALGSHSDAVERIAHSDQIVTAGFRDDQALAFAVEQFDAELPSSALT
jgi:hypothetical protein